MSATPARDVLLAKNPLAKWPEAEARLTPEVRPEPRRSFRIAAGATVFTIGSCFARNIEEHLSLIGCKVPTLGFSVPKSEWAGRPNGILNKYTPAAIAQEVAWAARILKAGGRPGADDFAEMRWDLPDGRAVDLQLGALHPVERARFEERRRAVYDLFAQAFAADCVAITLGLTEAWRHRRTGLFVQKAPVSRELMRHLDDFEFVRLDFAACAGFLRDTVAAIRDLNPGVKFLITTSPVPMEKTFTDEDVIIANMTSKATLRAAAAAVVAETDGADYFPSFEAALLTERGRVFAEDLLHVQDAFVARIVEQLARDYFDIGDALGPLVQNAAAELADPAAGDAGARALVAADPAPANLQTDQLVVYLHACWRLGARARVPALTAEILRRPQRSAVHLRTLRNVLPRAGHAEEARRYAAELLAQDPSNKLARKLVEGPDPADAAGRPKRRLAVGARNRRRRRRLAAAPPAPPA